MFPSQRGFTRPFTVAGSTCGSAVGAVSNDNGYSFSIIPFASAICKLTIAGTGGQTRDLPVAVTTSTGFAFGGNARQIRTRISKQGQFVVQNVGTCFKFGCQVALGAPVGLDTFETEFLSDTGRQLTLPATTTVQVIRGHDNPVQLGTPGPEIVKTIGIRTNLPVPMPYFEIGHPVTAQYLLYAYDPGGWQISGPLAEPIALTASDPAVTVTPSTFTTFDSEFPAFTVSYDGSHSVASQVTISASATGAKTGSTALAFDPLVEYGYLTGGGIAGFAAPNGLAIDPEFNQDAFILPDGVLATGPNGHVYLERARIAVGEYSPRLQTFIGFFRPHYPVRGIAVDGRGFIYLSQRGFVGVYAPTAPAAGGSPAPVRAFAADLDTLAVNRAGELFGRRHLSTKRIDVYAPGATGSPAPAYSVAAPAGAAFEELAVDEHRELFVSGTLHGARAVFVYATGPQGAVPSRILSGPDTGLANASLAADAGGRIYTAGSGNRFLTFAPLAGGDAQPVSSALIQRPLYQKPQVAIGSYGDLRDYNPPPLPAFASPFAPMPW